MKSKPQLVIFPLDHTLKWTADCELQTAKQLQNNHHAIIVTLPLFDRYAKLHRDGVSYPLFKRKRSPLVHYEYQPTHIFPLERFRIIYHLNLYISLIVFFIACNYKFGNHVQYVLWIFHPRFSWIRKVFKLFGGKNSKVVYECIDFISTPHPQKEISWRKGEKDLFSNADVVTTHAETLLKFHKTHAPNMKILPSGFRADDFGPYKRFAPRNKKTAKVGYLGALNHRINYPLLQKLVAQNPDVEFEFIGPLIGMEDSMEHKTRLSIKKLLGLSNFHHHDYIHPTKIPEYILQWQVGLIPYDMDIPLNKFCNPTKLLEYLYFGLPVLSSHIPEVELLAKKYPHVHLAETSAQWSQKLKGLMALPINTLEQKKMRQIALENSWGKKIYAIQDLLDLNPYN